MVQVRPPRTARLRVLAAKWGYLIPPLLLPLLVFWPRITGGGFTGDDWTNRAITMHSSLSQVIDPFLDAPLSHRVLHLPYAYLYDLVFTSHQRAYLLWAVLTAAVFGMLVAILLRRVQVPMWAASAIGALGVIYPYATITKIWATAHVGHITGSLAVLGVLLALRGLRQRHRASRFMHHGLALLLFWISLSIYEMALPIICAGGIFYLAATTQSPHTPDLDRMSTFRRFRPALVRWVVDVSFAAAWYLSLQGRTDIAGASQFSLLDRLGVLGSDGARNLAGSFVPFLADGSRPDHGAIYSGAWFSDALTVIVVEAVLIFAVICIAMPVVLRRIGNGSVSTPARRIRWWGVGIILSIVAAYAGWLAIVPANDYYRPVPFDSPALRINVVAAFGLAAVVVCTLGGLAELVRALVPERPRFVPTLLIVLGLLAVTITYARHDRSEIHLWNQASTEQVHILGSVKTAFQNKAPRPGTTVILTDTPGYIADGAEVFYTSWSFRGALQTMYKDLSLEGVPHREVAQFQCRRDGIAPFYVQFRLNDPHAIARYGTTFFVSSRRSKKWKLSDRRSCRRAVREAGLQQIPTHVETPALGTT